MSQPKPAPRQEFRDPVYLHARRESLWILLIWAACMVWCVGYSYLFGYDLPPEGEIPITLGMPSWVVWGVLAPWIAATIVSVWFSLFYMRDDDLGEKLPEHDAVRQAEATDD